YSMAFILKAMLSPLNYRHIIALALLHPRPHRLLCASRCDSHRRVDVMHWGCVGNADTMLASRARRCYTRRLCRISLTILAFLIPGNAPSKNAVSFFRPREKTV